MAVTVSVGASSVDVAFTGKDALWALRRSLRVPLKRVHGARVMARRDAEKECPWLRLPGSYLPRMLRAGSYGVGARRQLWCVHRADTVLVVELRGRPYSRIVLQTREPHRLAGQINAALPQ